MTAVGLRDVTLEDVVRAPSAGLMTAAERYLTASLLEHPTDARLYYWRARVRHLRGACEQAEADYTMALARGYRDPVGLLVQRAELHAAAADYDRAESDYAAAIARDEGDFRGYAARSLHRHRQGEHERAVQDIDRAIAIAPERADGYYDRSAYLAALDRVDEALVDLDRAFELDQIAT